MEAIDGTRHKCRAGSLAAMVRLPDERETVDRNMETALLRESQLGRGPLYIRNRAVKTVAIQRRGQYRRHCSPPRSCQSIAPKIAIQRPTRKSVTVSSFWPTVAHMRFMKTRGLCCTECMEALCRIGSAVYRNVSMS